MADNNLQKIFSEKVIKSQGIIHKVCRMYCDNSEHRKDLFQEILIQLWKSYPSFRNESKFSTWMYRVAINVALQDLRKIKKENSFFVQTNQFVEEPEENNSSLYDEKLAQMYRAIAYLNKVEKAIVMLYLDNKKNDEIAEIIGITQNYVRVKMNRIKLKLSKKIKEV